MDKTLLDEGGSVWKDSRKTSLRFFYFSKSLGLQKEYWSCRSEIWVLHPPKYPSIYVPVWLRSERLSRVRPCLPWAWTRCMDNGCRSFSRFWVLPMQQYIVSPCFNLPIDTQLRFKQRSQVTRSCNVSENTYTNTHWYISESVVRHHLTVTICLL